MKWVVLSDTVIAKVWENAEKLCNIAVKQPTIMIWGCFTFYGVGTDEFVSGNMNSVKYMVVLEDNIWSVFIKYFKRVFYLQGWRWAQSYFPCHQSLEGRDPYSLLHMAWTVIRYKCLRQKSAFLWPNHIKRSMLNMITMPW